MNQSNEQKSKKHLYILGPLILLIALVGVSYAFFNYTRTGAANTLVVGNIYFNHTQGDAITLLNEFPMPSAEARERSDNYVTFQITGKNESERDVYYKLMISHGNDIEGRDRIDDKYLRFDLIEILSDNTEKYLVYDESFDTINNTVLLKDRVEAGTTNTITRNYKLRMWIDKDLKISDTDDDKDYTSADFEKLFASVKVTVKGDTPKVYYYSSLDDAATAINAETINSEQGRSTAKVGVYTDSDDNTTNLVFYDDIDVTNSIDFNKSVDINLYGNTITIHKRSTNSSTFLAFYEDSSVQNGTINGEDTYDSVNYFGLAFDEIHGVINNVNFPTVSSDDGYIIQSNGGGDLTIKNSTVGYGQIHANYSSNVNLVNSHTDTQLVIYSNSTSTVTDSEMYNGDTKDSIIYVWDSGSKLVVNNSKIFADSPGCYIKDGEETYYNASIGIMNAGTLIFNSGYVFGTHSAVETAPGSKTYVYGGTFESTDHGGFYFAHGPSGVAYIENANINGISYPAEGKYRPNGSAPTFDGYHLEEGKVSFYIGGETSENNEEVYMVNCNISAVGSQFLVMRYSTPIHSLYMSGCKFNNTRDNHYVRIDYVDKMRLYNGYNNDFGVINKFGKLDPFMTYDEAVQNGTIVVTNANYKGVKKPE